MLFYTALALASSTGLVTAIPLSLQPRDVANFPAGTSWDILLSRSGVGNVRVASKANVEVIDVDLFDTDSGTINDLKQDKKVICYFSAGSREDWRPDAAEFQNGDFNKPLDGWAGENWLNIKSENVMNIMKKRIKQAADKGCHAIDPDNVDGYNENQDGYGYSPEDHANYIKQLAAEAQKHNLAIGLKNAVEIIPQVVDVIQFAVNEACHEYNECDRYKPLTDKNLAVFNIEYGGNDCGSPAGVTLSTLIKPEDQSLSTLGSGGCPNTPQDNPSNTIGAPPTPTQTQVDDGNDDAPAQPTAQPPAQTAQPVPSPPAAVPEPSEEEDDDDDDNAPSPCQMIPYWKWRGGKPACRKPPRNSQYVPKTIWSR
jgi:hypothetical protein